MDAVRHKKQGSDGRAPARTCIVSRAVCEPDQLIRFAVDPEGWVIPDLAGRLPGRGAWVDGLQDSVEKAVHKGAFARAFKRRVSVPDDLPERIALLLVKRAIQALSLANKAGLVVCGFGKVDGLIQSGQAMALIHALDASDGGAGRLSRKYQAVCREAKIMPVIVQALTIDQLCLATGRENVVHAALSPGRAAEGFVSAAERLMRYRPPIPNTLDGMNANMPASDGLARQQDVGPETEVV